MKTSRVLPKSPSKPPKNQVTKRKPKPGIDDLSMQVVFFEPGVNFETDEESTVTTRAKIPSALFTRLFHKSNQSGRSLTELLRDGLDRVLAPEPAARLAIAEDETPDFLSAADKLDAARAQSTALHALLAECIPANEDVRYNEDISWGIKELIQQTDARLKCAIELATTRPSNIQEAA